MKAEDPILQLYLRYVDIVHNLSIGQQGVLEYIGCSKELLPLPQGAAIGLMIWPVPFLAVAVTVDKTNRISRLVLWRVHTADTPYCRVLYTIGTLREICWCHLER
jgi:hypothetical protein